MNSKEKQKKYMKTYRESLISIKKDKYEEMQKELARLKELEKQMKTKEPEPEKEESFDDKFKNFVRMTFDYCVDNKRLDTMNELAPLLIEQGTLTLSEYRDILNKVL